jgi:microcystin-dependent protein
MPVEPYIRRQYAGGTEALQLAGEVQAGDLSIPCDQTVGNPAQWPTGNGGSTPFTIAIDQGLPSFEKVLCSEFTPATNTFTVYQHDGWNGRGFDGPGPQGHVPQAMVPQVILTWSSVEADEANEMVHAVMGGATNQPDGNVLTSQFGKPTWQSPAGGAAGLFPIGGIILWADGTVANFPTNFFNCNGQSLDMTTYAALYAIIGGTYGQNIGANTFQLPNFNNRFPIGQNTVAATVGAVGGSRSITTGNMPIHNHGNTTTQSVNHTHNFPASSILNTAGASAPDKFQSPWTGANQYNFAAITGMDTSVEIPSTHVHGTNNAGSGSPYDPPYIGMLYLMRCL